MAGGQAQRGHGARQAQRCMRDRERGRSGYLGTSDRNRSWLTLAQKECSGKIWVSPHNQQKMRRPRPRAGRWLGWPWRSRWPTPGGWTAEWTRAGMGGEGGRDRWWGGGESGGRESGCGETLAQEQGQPAGGRGASVWGTASSLCPPDAVWGRGRRPGSRSSFGSHRCRATRERVRIGREEEQGLGRCSQGWCVPLQGPARPRLGRAVCTGRRCCWCLFMPHREPELSGSCLLALPP